MFALSVYYQCLSLGRVTLIAYSLLFLLQYQLFMHDYRDLVPYPTPVSLRVQGTADLIVRAVMLHHVAPTGAP
jgi:hypothetical protein